MAIPSGAGTEVLCRGTMGGTGDVLTNDPTAQKFTSPYICTMGAATEVVPADTIITVLSIIATENAGASAGETLLILAKDGAREHTLAYGVTPASGTFVWNDKFVLMPGDQLIMYTSNAGNMSVWTTFIKQDFS